MRRILWLMIGAVLMPGLVLVWVGTRSVREDRALQEVRTRALTEQTAVLLLRDVETALADYEQRPTVLLLAPTSGVCALARCGDALTRRVRGNGLGPTPVKQIVESHGGDVRVVSHEGRGRRFTVRLPLEFGRSA